MTINEKFLEFVIKLAIDEDFNAAFAADAEGAMTKAGLSDPDKVALRRDRLAPVRAQVENVQSSGNVKPRPRKSGPKRAGKKR